MLMWLNVLLAPVKNICLFVEIPYSALEHKVEKRVIENIRKRVVKTGGTYRITCTNEEFQVIGTRFVQIKVLKKKYFRIIKHGFEAMNIPVYYGIKDGEGTVYQTK